MRDETQVLTVVELEIRNLTLRRFSLWESFKSLNVKNAIGTLAREGRLFRTKQGSLGAHPLSQAREGLRQRSVYDSSILRNIC